MCVCVWRMTEQQSDGDGLRRETVRRRLASQSDCRDPEAIWAAAAAVSAVRVSDPYHSYIYIYIYIYDLVRLFS